MYQYYFIYLLSLFTFSNGYRYLLEKNGLDRIFSFFYFNIIINVICLLCITTFTVTISTNRFLFYFRLVLSFNGYNYNGSNG